MQMKWNPELTRTNILMEGNPHQLIAGMIIAAYAIQAQKAYIFIRWAYKKAEIILRKAIAEAYEAGYLGKKYLGTGYDLDLYLHSSAGRYICGEETALINSLEGKRGIPRAKPPFPATSGLFGQPTVVNNVETLCWIPHIVEKELTGSLTLSLTGEGGTKIYGVSGRGEKTRIYGNCPWEPLCVRLWKNMLEVCRMVMFFEELYRAGILLIL